MDSRWILKEIDAEVRDDISREHRLAPLAAAVLAARGYRKGDELDAFLKPLDSRHDPLLLAGMEEAVERLARAAKSKETVWIYTDYDVDGVTSAVLLAEFFKASGITSLFRLPRRDREGYGFNVGILEEIASWGGTILITADCGITAVEEAKEARRLGIDLIVTDHHTPGEEIPDAAAVINPKLPSSVYPDRELAGVGVAFNVVTALRRRLREENYYSGGNEPNLDTLLDLVALGTVADIAPLVGVNRILVTSGLKVLNGGSVRPGVEALREVAGLKGSIKAGNIGFQIAPRLNAAGRMKDPRAACRLLSTKNPNRAHTLASELEILNRARQSEEKKIVKEAEDRVENEGWHPERWSLVLESPEWNPGVIGIAASRLVGKYFRPAVVISISDSPGKGSARSIPGLNLHEAFSECADLLVGFGGHSMAAGFTIEAADIPAFRERFEHVVTSKINGEDLVPLVTIDGEAGFDELSCEGVRALDRLEPFGSGIRHPLSSNVEVLDVKPLGKTGEHLKITLGQGERSLVAKAWRMAEKLSHIGKGSTIDVVHRPEINFMRGPGEVELTIKGIRLAGHGE